MGEERAILMENLPEAVQAAEQARNNRESGIMDLFGEVEQVQRKPLKPIKPWSDEVRLKGEKDTLGLYLTGHPIDVYKDELKRFIPNTLNNLSTTRRGQTTVIAGLIIDVAHFPNRTMITLDDGTARFEISTNRERFERYKEFFQNETVVVIEGEIYEREGFDRPLGRLSKAFNLNQIREKRAQAIHLRFHEDELSADFANDLLTAIEPFCQVANAVHIPIKLQLENHFATYELQLGEAWQVTPTDDLMLKLRDHLGKEHIRVEYQVKSKAAQVVKPKYQVIDEPPLSPNQSRQINEDELDGMLRSDETFEYSEDLRYS